MTKIHYMGEAGVMNTACGRYVALSGSRVLWTPQSTEVTCAACQKAMTL